jgi:hypothetical protein
VHCHEESSFLREILQSWGVNACGLNARVT